ncbi:histidinol-phosphate transaminase [Mycetocola reblochoni]|uniref:Histidinol-phosphate aminotransferase n=1 Tax=Mycetocola reblochoni TaxID=331618 RepID=A0A3L6ZJG9_9MICO|nr:histidinol-phosphate transaminase [Mycetocola reblochoni]RLP68126.1 histidinol-phosphate transaminase [Mycetocola reblochoni]
MTTLADLPLRDDLRGRTPYGAPQAAVGVPLNVNENSFGIPDVVRDDIAASLARVVSGVNRYPDREFTSLRHALASYLGHGLRADQLWAANGSNEVLQQVLQAFGGPGRTVLGFSPTYSMYPLLSSGVGSTWIAGERDEAFELGAETARRQVEQYQPDVVILCTPNNPTGTDIGLDVVEAVYEAANGIVIVDEAYQEFSDRESALTLLPGRERLFVSRTMSKAFAFAGVRLGYLAADPVAIDALRLVRLPYHLSALTQAAAEAALRHSEVMLANVAAIAAQRDRISSRLVELGYAPYRSAANFVLFGGVADPAGTFSRLLERDILIRDVGLPGHLRVTAGTEPETTAFLTALAEIGNDA